MPKKTIYCKSKYEKFLWLLYGIIILPILLVLMIISIILMIPLFLISGTYCTLKGMKENTTYAEWRKFDTKIVSDTKSEFIRFILSFWTNKREPMPAGGEKDRWKTKSNLSRYILWHIRNPSADFKNFYFGFYNKKDEYIQKYIFEKGKYHGKFYLEYIIKTVPGRIFYYPYLKILYDKWTFAIGWKRRGTGSIELNTDRR